MTIERPLPATEPVTKSLWKRRLAAVSRWLHIYVSMASFAILFFFAATGITLNHPDIFGGEQRSVQLKGELNPQWLKAEVAKLNVVEDLRNRHRIHAALSDFRVDDAQCAVSFKGPGYTADVFIDRASGRYELTESRMGLVAIINDLHKGRDTGRVWSVLIDASAALMCFVSITGLVLLFFLQKRRTAGLLAFAAGAVFCALVYAVWVP